VSDAVLRDSTIDVRGENPVGLLIGSLVGGEYLAERVAIDSDDRGVVSGPQPGSDGMLAQVGVRAGGPALSVERSTLRVASSVFEGSEPVRVTADLADATFVADHVTLATTAPTGVEVLGQEGETAAAVLRNTIVAGPGRAFSRIGDGGTALITTDHVAHKPVAPGDESGSGALVLQHSLPLPTAFADAAYRLPAGSPLVDAGTAPTIDEPAADLDGRPRVADGDGDCAAASDIGAYERPAGKQCGTTPPPPSTRPAPAADTTAPVVAALKVRRRGTRLKLRLSEAATVRVRVQKRKAVRWRTVKTIRRAAPAGAVGLKLTKRGAGRRRVAVVATDAAGNRSAPVRKRYRLAAAAH
jgi:hypothetical protein